jgi:nitrite reductase (NADH) large subunit
MNVRAAARSLARASPDAAAARQPRLLAIVGNGMAAGRTLEELLKLAPGAYRITVFGAEPHPNYNRILLSAVLSGEADFDDIVEKDAAWYRARDVALRPGVRVTRIDRSRRLVIADDGTASPYDRLLLATGSHPVRAQLPGADLAGVITYRDIADTRTMIRVAARARHAVVIGGGLLGLEAANGLNRRGMHVTVVHLRPWLMERQLDAAAAGVLQAGLEARGIRFRVGAQTKEIRGYAGAVRAVRLADGSELPADIVVFAIGIRPNVELARAAGLACERGVLVSDTMQTYDPRIYAVGECVAHRGVSYGLVAPLYDMARVCAQHLAGAAVFSYRGSVPATRLKVTGVDVFSAGRLAAGPGTEDIVYADAPARVYRKLVLREGRLAGAVMVGNTADADWYQGLIESQRDVSALRGRLMFGRAIAEAA